MLVGTPFPHVFPFSHGLQRARNLNIQLLHLQPATTRHCLRRTIRSSNQVIRSLRSRCHVPNRNPNANPSSTQTSSLWPRRSSRPTAQAAQAAPPRANHRIALAAAPWARPHPSRALTIDLPELARPMENCATPQPGRPASPVEVSWLAAEDQDRATPLRLLNLD